MQTEEISNYQMVFAESGIAVTEMRYCNNTIRGQRDQHHSLPRRKIRPNF
jgi:hypothetical protein